MPCPSVRRCVTAVLIGVGVATLFTVTTALGQQADWYPSRWGADDQRGAVNLLTPGKVLEAKNLITTGEVYELGRVYETGMPLFGEPAL